MPPRPTRTGSRSAARRRPRPPGNETARITGNDGGRPRAGVQPRDRASTSPVSRVRRGGAPHDESSYQALFAYVPIGLYRTTLEGRIVDVNPAMVELLGYPSREALLRANAADLYVDPADRRRALDTLQQDMVVRDLDIRLRRFDGSIVWVRDSVRAICDAQGRPGYFLGSLEDVTHRRRAAEELQSSVERLRRAMIGTIEGMAAIAEMRDPYTAGHQRRVAQLAEAIATSLALTEPQRQGVRLASLIHDIGKIYVPAEILSKPGRLTEIEFNLIRLHPEVGYEILKRIDFPWPLASIVLQHHELLDGSGYPKGLRGDEIRLEARILAVADVVEAMLSHRPYRPSLGRARALRQVRTHRGRLYDAEVVDACLALWKRGFAFDEPSLMDANGK